VAPLVCSPSPPRNAPDGHAENNTKRICAMTVHDIHHITLMAFTEWPTSKVTASATYTSILLTQHSLFWQSSLVILVLCALTDYFLSRAEDILVVTDRVFNDHKNNLALWVAILININTSHQHPWCTFHYRINIIITVVITVT